MSPIKNSVRFCRLLTLAWLAIGFTCSAHGQAENDAAAVAKFGSKQVDVYLLGGQSNMQGVGKLSKLEKARLGKVPRVRFFEGKQWVDMVVGTTKTSARLQAFGPEVGMAWQLSNALESKKSRDVALVKYYASGQPLHHGWNGNKWAGENFASGRRNFYPGKNIDDVNQGTLYQAMLSRFRSSLEELERQGINYRIAGFAWMQGEQDSKHVVSAGSYAASLKRLKRRLEEDLNKGNAIPMVFGQVLPHPEPLPRFVARDLIRQRMAEADQDSGNSNSIPGCKMISTDEFTLLPDKVHYNADGQWELGVAFGKQLRLMRTTTRKRIGTTP